MKIGKSWVLVVNRSVYQSESEKAVNASILKIYLFIKAT